MVRLLPVRLLFVQLPVGLRHRLHRLRLLHRLVVLRRVVVLQLGVVGVVLLLLVVLLLELWACAGPATCAGCTWATAIAAIAFVSCSMTGA